MALSAETITISSPSVFLSSPIDLNSPPLSEPKRPAKKRQPTQPKPAATEECDRNVAAKRKQSKSRNGCITCKAKRLKCDETKPSCQQCARRNVTCGGYKKDFKWRPFEEASFTGKPAVGKQKKSSQSPPPEHPPQSQHRPRETSKSANATIQDGQRPLPESLQFSDISLPLTPFSGLSGLPSPNIDSNDIFGSSASMPSMFMPIMNMDQDEGLIDENTMFDMQGAMAMSRGMTMPSSMPSSYATTQGMDFMGLAMSSPDLMANSPCYSQFGSNYFGQRRPDEEDFIEEVVRQPNLNPEYGAWVGQLPNSPPMSFSSSWADGLMDSRNSPRAMIFREPQFAAGSAEMLALRFDRQTCGILSVKDGPTENPWRTLVWPLARDSPALYHAIASMTSFHTSRHQPQLRVQGIEHMRTSIEALASGIANMRFDTAIATTLALAFSESWDQHTSTGINHIKGAKILVNQALTRHRHVAFSGEELTRLKFLCNTWIYMDVIARLTSIDDDDAGSDYDSVNARLSGTLGDDSQLDPLMGCATTLFPIIGRVGSLVRRVRRSASNSPAVISRAMVLKSQLQSWVSPAVTETPEDPSLQIQHSVQTAEAYRWATLLYLHQAVPEIPSPPSAELAKKVMVYLATVPLTSRAVIVQIFPLIAAGSEAVGEEDRCWVSDRWEAMAQRMRLGIIDRCHEIVKEVWDRRDAYEEKTSRAGLCVSLNSLRKRYVALEQESTSPLGWKDPFCIGAKVELDGREGTEFEGAGVGETPRKPSHDANGEVDKEFTVRGSLHWLGVMKEWQWEVLLG